MTQKPYQLVGVGGTFDHFHAGHERLLRFAAALGDKLSIGVTTNSFAADKAIPWALQSFSQRKKAVEQFCQENQIAAKCFELNSVEGPTLGKTDIAALAVTTETERGGVWINQQRQTNGFAPLPLYVCELALAHDNQPIHSVRIRKGEIDRNGMVYQNLFKSPITITDHQRQSLAKPQGAIVKEPSKRALTLHQQGAPIILVGDSTIDRFKAEGWPYNLGIFDLKVERKPATGFTKTIKPTFVTDNPASTIQPELVQRIATVLKSADTTKPLYVHVNGEEDLAAVPVVLLAPLGSTVYYGQPSVGLVEVQVTELLKQRLLALFE